MSIELKQGEGLELPLKSGTTSVQLTINEPLAKIAILACLIIVILCSYLGLRVHQVDQINKELIRNVQINDQAHTNMWRAIGSRPY